MSDRNKMVHDWLKKNIPKSQAFNERLKEFIKPYIISYKNDQTNNGGGPQEKSEGDKGKKI